MEDLEPLLAGKPVELFAVDDVLERARGVEEPRRNGAALGCPEADHRHQRRDPRAARDEEQRPAGGRLPDEVAADRPAQLEPVAHGGHIDEVGRYLAVLEPLHRDRRRLTRRGGDRVAALGLVAVLGGEAHVEVLAGPMARPVRHVEYERPHARRLLDGGGHLGEQPGQSPEYRCSCHGSPRMW